MPSNKVELLLASPKEQLLNGCILCNRWPFKKWFGEGNGGHWHTLIRRQHGKGPWGRSGESRQKEQSQQITKGRKECSRNKTTILGKVWSAKGLRSSNTSEGKRRDEDRTETQSQEVREWMVQGSDLAREIWNRPRDWEQNGLCPETEMW